jgi:RNA polymerase sigma-70 factor (ECF subfamily)
MMLEYNKFNNATMRTTKLSHNNSQNGNDEYFASCMKDIADNQDKSSYASIFKHFAPRLKSYFVKAGASENQAEEVIQEVMIAVWTKAASYDKSKSSVTTWLYTIARNKRIDKIRKEKRHYLLESDEGLEVPVPSSQEGEIMSWQLSNKIKAFLDILPKEQSMLLKLSYFYEKTHSDIAKDLSLPLGTVKSRIRLALSKMKNLVELN